LSPFWTPDGKRIIYEVNAPNEARDSTGKTPSVSGGSLLSLPGDGSGVSPEPASPSGHFHPYGWSSDGKDLIATQYDGSETNVVRFPPAANGTILPLVKTPAAEGQNGLSTSPDGKWLAYSSNTTGAFEIWVRSLTETGAPIRVSPNGGIDPLWARNGKELYYFEGTRLMAVDVDTRSGFNFKPAVRLFDVPYMNAFGQPPHYDVTAKGEFLLLRPANPTVSPITVILNWAK
jgi:serine/threonine-protein kinase